MKEIKKLKSFSKDLSLFRRKYEFNDLKVKRKYDDHHFLKLIQGSECTVDDTPKLKFWFCLEFFFKKINSLTIKIKDKVETNMSQPFTTTQKSENLKTLISECIILYLDFSLLASQFGRSRKLNIDNIESSKLLLAFVLLLNIKNTSINSGIELVNDMYNYSEKLFKTDAIFIVNEISTLSQENILAFSSDLISSELFDFINYLMTTYPQYINENEIERIMKKMKKGLEVNKVVKRGRPSKPIETRTIKDIWKTKEFTFDDALIMLKKQRPFLDNNESFVIDKNEKNVWQKVPSGQHSKYIQGFLQFCHNNKMLDLELFTGYELQKIFENTFQLKPNIKTFNRSLIFAVNSKYSNLFNI